MTGHRTIADLIPAYYLSRDLDPSTGDGLLDALTKVLERGIADIESEHQDRYDDLFVETCGPDELEHFLRLLGIRELPGRRPPRALVANVLRYRRRKGTVAALEDLARTASGWTAKATEQFPILVVSTSVKHVRPGYVAVTAIRDPLPLIATSTPFDGNAVTPDIRAIESQQGRANLPNVAVDVWRLEPVTELKRAACPVDTQRFRFNPLGLDLPLYTIGDQEPDIEHRVGRLDVTAPLRMLEAKAWWQNLYGEGSSLVVYEAGVEVPIADTVVCDLADTTTGWANGPAIPRLAVDPTRGRLAFSDPPVGEIQLSYCRALPLPVGGGGYERQQDDADGSVVVTVAADGTADAASIEAGLAALVLAGGVGAVEITDSARYTPSGPMSVAASNQVTVRATPGTWPIVTNGLTFAAAEGSIISVEGLIVSGGPLRIDGAAARLYVSHCTLVPGGGLMPDGVAADPTQPALVVEVDAGQTTEVHVDHSLLGAVHAPTGQGSVEISDSIVCGEPVRSPARQVSMCVGGVLAAMPSLAAGPLQLMMHLGVEADLVVTLAGTPTSLDEVAAALEAAIRGTSDQDLGDALAGLEVGTDDMTVSVHDDRLLITGSGVIPISFSDVDTDTTASQLALTDQAVSTFGVIGDQIDDPPPLSPSGLNLTAVVRAGGATSQLDLALPQPPTSRDDAAGLLQAILSAALGGAGAVVLSRSSRLIAAPTAADTALSFGPGVAVEALGLHTPEPALSSSGGHLSGGPTLRTERTTWLGDVMADLVEASDCIFEGTLTSARRQRGCIRYSWVGAASTTPRRFRSRSLDAGDPPPAFVSHQFGHAAFGQLSPTCPPQIAQGAEDGAEMGAFHDVQQPDRTAAVRSLLDEYLRFSARAGIFLVS